MFWEYYILLLLSAKYLDPFLSCLLCKEMTSINLWMHKTDAKGTSWELQGCPEQPWVQTSTQRKWGGKYGVAVEPKSSPTLKGGHRIHPAEFGEFSRKKSHVQKCTDPSQRQHHPITWGYLKLKNGIFTAWAEAKPSQKCCNGSLSFVPP